MKKILPFLAFLGCFTFSFAQELDDMIDDPGDVMIVGFSHVVNDGFSFLAMDNIIDGVSIVFTDEEWTGTEFVTLDGEGDVTWTNNTGNTIAAGTVIHITDASDTPSASIGSVTESEEGFGVSSLDELYAFTGSRSAPTFLSFFTGKDNSFASLIDGTGLVEGTTAIFLDAPNNFPNFGVTNGTENLVFNGPTTCNGDLLTCLQNLYNVANWNDDMVTYPGSVPDSFNGTLFGDIIADHTVTLQDVEFIPRDLTIRVGETVEWNNVMGTHNVNGSLATYPNNPEGFFSGDAAIAPWTFSHTFTQVGFYNYQCDPHVDFDMLGTVTVLPQVCTIASVTTNNMDGIPDSLGVNCELQGIVYGINYRPSGLQFTLIDSNNDGIAIFSSSDNFGYTVNEGDEVTVSGEVTFFNGLTQFNPDTVIHISSGNALFSPTVVTALGENTESQLVTIENVSLVNPTDWNDSGSFNVDVTDGTNTFTVRIDSDTDISGMGAPTGTFSITGLGGQFDSSAPHDEGYQLLPRYATDIDPYVIEMPAFPPYPIGTISTVDVDGNPDSLGVACQIQGVVYGVNLRGSSGLQFTIIDDNNDGIAIFDFSDDFGYSVQEGDEIIVQGEVTFFNGLIQFAPDSIELVDAGNSLVSSTVVTAFGEDTESQLITIENVSIVDPGQWTNSGSGFNVDVTDGTNTYVVRIDNDVDIYSMGVPQGTFNVTGLGGQFDSSEPYLEGYQLLPRYAADIDPYVIEMPEFPPYPIGVITTVDANGDVDSLGVACQIQGVVYGVNLRGSGLQFTVIDDNNDGIHVFSSSEDFGYTVQEGDEIILQGEVAFFNGLTQFTPSSLEFVDAGNTLFDPTVVTALGEDTESQLVTLENVSIVDPGQWTNSGSGFNVDVTDGTNTYVIRIDNEVDIYTMGVPLGTFNVTGLGGQFDSESPYFDGYQLLPRYAADIDPYDTEEVTYPPYTIGEVTTNDVNGNPDSLGVNCELRGVVYGVNLRLSGGGLQFTLIDDNNDGIHVFSNSDDLGFTVTEGDEIVVQGQIAFFSGLTEIVPVNITTLSTGNALFDPTVVTDLGEDTESQLIRINGLSLVDPAEWTNSGSGFNVNATDGTVTIQIRIDADTDVFGTDPPTGTFDLIGLGGQFDSSEPYDEGYQIFPRYMPDILEVSSVSSTVIPEDIEIFPNPTRSDLQIKTLEGLDLVRVSNIFGQQIMEVVGPADTFELSLNNWPDGVYIITLYRQGKQWSTKVVKE